jgi:hypothetical protein
LPWAKNKGEKGTNQKEILVAKADFPGKESAFVCRLFESFDVDRPILLKQIAVLAVKLV